MAPSWLVAIGVLWVRFLLLDEINRPSRMTWIADQSLLRRVCTLLTFLWGLQIPSSAVPIPNNTNRQSAIIWGTSYRAGVPPDLSSKATKPPLTKALPSAWSWDEPVNARSMLSVRLWG